MTNHKLIEQPDKILFVDMMAEHLPAVKQHHGNIITITLLEFPFTRDIDQFQRKRHHNSHPLDHLESEFAKMAAGFCIEVNSFHFHRSDIYYKFRRLMVSELTQNRLEIETLLAG